MQQANHPQWRHTHDYTIDTSMAERRTHIVMGITATMMIVEIGAGIMFGSMALLADGWHMSTHVAAFCITALAYYFSRQHRDDVRFCFGTGKMGILGSFASAIVLVVVALLMAGESVHRFFAPQPIQFKQAIGVAVVGLVINLTCTWLLKGDDSHHHHEHGHGHDLGNSHESGSHDLNLRAAYVHVLADALTSVTAIVALTFGKYLGWYWLDPLMGIVGSVVVSIWAYGLIRDSSGILLDRTPESSDLPNEIRRAVENDGSSFISDLHVWQVSAGKFAAIVSIVGCNPKPTEIYHEMFREHAELVHVTIEIWSCTEE